MAPVPLRILVVEDEPDVRKTLTDVLAGDGHQVEAVGDGRSALDRGAKVSFDVVLLGLEARPSAGLEVCRGLRRTHPTLPILALGPRPVGESRANGLPECVDDLLTPPFEDKELLVRVKELHRRAWTARDGPEEGRPGILVADDCVLDLGRRLAIREGITIRLTPREVRILRWLHDHRNRPISRAELLERVWGVPGDLQTRTVDMTISNLRHKIESDPSEPRIVVTVKGVGYAWGTSDEPLRSG